MDLIHRLSYRYPAAVLEAFLYVEPLEAQTLQHQETMQHWLEKVQQQLKNTAEAGLFFELVLSNDLEHKAYMPSVKITTHGVDSHYHFQYDFFSSSDYQTIASFGAEISQLLEPGAFVQREDKELRVGTFKEAMAWLMSEAKKGQQIQRYKGLGEMNPDQLWETTMDPNVRRMMVVTIEDVVAADQIFTTLMGDNVESRRAFIETNALLVGNLDI